jgi:hypothetical protein
VAAGVLDPRALALLTFLSRDGLALSVSTAGGESARGGGDQQHVRAIDIWAVDGAPIAGHQGAGTLTDVAIRTLLTLPRRIAPQAILSLMRYPGAPRTYASALYWNRIHVSFAPPARSDSVTPSAAARTAHVTKPSVASAQTIVLSAAQWEGLLARIGALASPSVAVKPSTAAIADPK